MAAESADQSAFPTTWIEVAKRYRDDQDTALDLAEVRAHLLFDLGNGTPTTLPTVPFPTPPHLRFLESEARSAVTLAASYYHYRPAASLLEALEAASPQLLGELALSPSAAQAMTAKLAAFALLAAEAEAQLQRLRWSVVRGELKRLGRLPGRPPHLTLDASRHLRDYLASLPRAFVGGELAEQIHKLLEPIFPNQLTAKRIEDSFAKHATHKRQFSAAFAKPDNLPEKPT